MSTNSAGNQPGSFNPRARSARLSLRGVVTPSGIATDDTTKYFFNQLIRKRLLVSLFDFENKERIFPAVAPVVKFCLLTITGDSALEGQVADFVFFALSVDDLKDLEKHFTLSLDDIALLNPNTGTCPIFRSRKDAELTKKIHGNIPVMVREGEPEVNPWGISFQRMFDMANDSSLFKTREQMETEGYTLAGNLFERGAEYRRYLPLYEAKLFHHFNHRYNSFEGVGQEKRFLVKAAAARMSVESLMSPKCLPLPRYWVEDSYVKERLGDSKWLALYRDTTNVMSNRRNAVFTIAPAVAASHKCPRILSEIANASEFCTLLACLNSFVFDYCVRQKLPGGTLSYFILKQIPVPSPDTIREFDKILDGNAFEWISRRVVELVYTSWDLQVFAQECGYAGEPFIWDEERRAALRADLDSACFLIYGCSIEEASHILDTFTIAKRQDEVKFGTFRSKDLIMDRLKRLHMQTDKITAR